MTVSRYKLIFPLLVPAGHQPRLLSQIKPEPSRAFISLLSFPVRESAAQLSAAPWSGSSLHASTRLSTFSVIGNICQSPSNISAEEFLLILSSSHQHMNLQFSFLFDFANHQYFSGVSADFQSGRNAREFQLSVFDFPVFKLWCWLSLRLPAIENCV